MMKQYLFLYMYIYLFFRSSGDGGVDLVGAFIHEDEKYVLVVQCKVNMLFNMCVLLNLFLIYVCIIKYIF